MGNMAINTNVLALNAHRNLSSVGSMQAKSSQRLSSGSRINSAADDAAGMAISEKMRSQIRGLDMASKNTQDGVSLVQTAEGGMQEIDNMLQRIRELTTQASNDTNENNFIGTGDRQKIQDEVDQLVSEIDAMAERTEFNNKKLINGSYSDVTVQLQSATAQLDKYKAAASDTLVKTAATKVSTAKTALANKQASIAALGAEIDIAISKGASTGALVGKMSALKTGLDTAKTNLAGVEKEHANLQTMNKQMKSLSVQVGGLTKLSQQGTSKLHFQVGANSNQSMYVNINSVKTDALGIGDGQGNSKIDLVKGSGSETSGYLKVLDAAITHVTTERSKLGATQNRLEYTQKSLDISSENLSAAESRIRDTDMAKEMMNMTKANVLQQAATSMLSQANQRPQNVLQLLQ